MKNFRRWFIGLLLVILSFNIQMKAFAESKLTKINGLEDKTTITLRLKPVENTGKITYILSQNEDPKAEKGIFLGMDFTHMPKWVLGYGENTLVTDSVVILDEWVFAAIVLDMENQQLRAIIGDDIYARKWKGNLSIDKFFLDTTGCILDDVQVHPGILTLEELEAFRGQPFGKNSWKYEIIDKTKYIHKKHNRTLQLKKELDHHPDQLQYEVTSSLIVEQRIDSKQEYAAKLDREDIITLKEVIVSEDKAFIETESGKYGFIETGEFFTSLISTDAGWLEKLIFTLSNISDNSNSNLTIMIYLIISLILVGAMVIVTKKAAGIKGIEIKGILSPAIYFFLLLIIAEKVSDKYETDWFLHEGWKRFPHGYSEYIHWFLFSALFIFGIYHLFKVVVLLRKCKVLIGLAAILCIILSNFIGYYALYMVYSLSVRNYSTLPGIGFIVVSLGSIAFYLKKNLLLIRISLRPDYVILQKEAYQYQDMRQGNTRKEKRTARDSNRENNEWKHSNETKDKDQGFNSNTSDTEGSNYSNWSDYNKKNSGRSYNGSSGSNTGGGHHDTSGYQKEQSHTREQEVAAAQFFKGVTNQEELRERYRGLMKLYHPDNQCGDTDMTKQIAEEYEALKKTLP